MDISYLPSIISLAGLFLVGLISPGPDFAIIVKNSLVHSRKAGLYTAFGLALGTLIHVTYSLLGLGFVIAKSSWLLLCVKYLGASYLIYIGYKNLKAQKEKMMPQHTDHGPQISNFAALKMGFLTSALNPKIILFFVSMFSVVVSSTTPKLILVIYGGVIFIETLAWFSFVAFCLSGERMRKKFISIRHWIERVTGFILIILGIKLLFHNL